MESGSLHPSVIQKPAEGGHRHGSVTRIQKNNGLVLTSYGPQVATGTTVVKDSCTYTRFTPEGPLLGAAS